MGTPMVGRVMRLIRRVKLWVRFRSHEADLADELAFHREMIDAAQSLLLRAAPNVDPDGLAWRAGTTDPAAVLRDQ